MKQFFQKLTLFLLLTLLLGALSTLTSCKKDSADNGGGSDSDFDRPEANVIKGTIRDAQGKLMHIAGASVDIYIEGIGANGDEATYTVHMDDHAHYRVKVSQGAYHMSVRMYAPLNGNIVCIDLVPLDGRPNIAMLETKPGIVRNYGLMLSGQLPGSAPNEVFSYAGAHLNVTDGARNFTQDGYWNSLSARFPGGQVNFVLTPKSPLIDGSEGSTVNVSCTVEDLATSYYFWDFPLAAYDVTASLTTADGQQVPLYLSIIPSLNASGNVTLLFPPDKDDHEGHPVMPSVAVWAQ